MRPEDWDDLDWQALLSGMEMGGASDALRAEGRCGMPHRVRHDVTFGALPLFMAPLESVLDASEAGELRAYYYETLMATLEAFEREMELERRRMHPLARPSSN